MAERVGGPGRVTPELYRLVGRDLTRLAPTGLRLGSFVGRDRELALLIDRAHQAVGGTGHAITVIGEPGVGKSRLIVELGRALALEGIQCWEGRCAAHGSSVPYLPLVDLLRRTWALDDDGSPTDVAATLRRRLGDLGLDAATHAPVLLGLLGIADGAEVLRELTPEAVRGRTFAALRSVVLAAARGRLVLLIEDVHWSDRTSEAFLAELVEGLPASPLLLVTTTRPGHAVPWLDRSSASQLGLPPLDPDESRRVVRVALGEQDVESGVLDQIAARGEGNAFFLEELALAVANPASRELGTAIPATIGDALDARMDRLPVGSRSTLQAASVLGRELSVQVLKALLPDVVGFQDAVRELVAREFLYEAPGSRLVFRHALTEEVAYRRLPAIERRRLHSAAGRLLESFYADRLVEIYDRLAHHYVRADEPAKAVEYLRRFGDLAARRYAVAEALEAYDQALEQARRLPDGPARDRATVEAVLGKSVPIMLLRGYVEIPALLEPYASLVHRLGDATLRSRYACLLAHAYSHLGDRSRADALSRLALGEAGDSTTAGMSQQILSLERFWTGQFREGVERGRAAVTLLTGGSEPFWLGFASWCEGLNAVALGDLSLALDVARRTEAIAATTGDPRNQSFGEWLRGWALALTGATTEAIEACQRALDLATDPVSRAVASQWLGFAHMEAGDPERAMPLLGHAVAAYPTFTSAALEGWAAAWLAEALAATHSGPEARRHAERAVAACRQVEFGFGAGLAQRALGRALLAEGNANAAAAELEGACGTLAAIGSRYELARAHFELARAHHARGEPDAAARSLAEAHRGFARLRVPHWTARTAALARLLGIGLDSEPAPGAMP
jgi:tetratricopeptide (TPR) repeat protein